MNIMRSAPRLIMAATQICLACFATNSLPTLAKAKISTESVQSCTDGISLVYRGNFETGITQLERAVSLSPENEIAVSYLAYAHNREGARISDARAYLARGQCFLPMKQYKLALTDFETALRYKPDSALAYRCVGIACSGLKEFDRSVKSFDKCLSSLQENLLNGKAYYYRAKEPKTL